MAERRSPAVYTIPPHRAFADALVAGIIAQHGADPLTLARGVILLPNNRAAQAVRDAFVRQAENGLLLPRLVPIGDEDMDARLGAALDPIAGESLLPAIDPLHRQFILARLIQQESGMVGAPINMAEAMRLAADMARTLDQLIAEGIGHKSLQSEEIISEISTRLSTHWQASFALLNVVLNQWPDELARRGMIDLSDRRNRLLRRLSQRWSETPPQGFVIVAGISTTIPSVAELLRVVAWMETGMVVLAGLDLHMSDEEWAEVGGTEASQAIETHPQFHLHLLLERMKVPRGLVRLWRRGSAHDAAPQRSRALSIAMQPPDYTKEWHKIASKELRLPSVTALECDTAAQEAQVIALRMRAALEVAGQTAALVTPDRDLAGRVVALLARWGVAVDDSAGLPLSATPTGGLIMALAEAMASDYAPVPLLSLLKHPLVKAGEGRLIWLDGVRALDLALRGPRPATGLAGVSAFLAHGDERTQRKRARAADWWCTVEPLLASSDAMIRLASLTLPKAIAALTAALESLGGDDIWAGAAGHAAAELFTDLEAKGADGPLDFSLSVLPMLLRQLMAVIAVKPARALHPRLFVWGLLEAKLQTADVMILSGLNEAVWPALPTPDPWLAPAIRKTLKLPTLERRIGLSAHDLVGAMGAKEVMLTRARRDARSPTIASRFWLRLEAMTGGLSAPNTDYRALSLLLDQPEGAIKRAVRPAPVVPLAQRPKIISVTAVDTLKADPYAFYAEAILNLRAIDPVDAEPSAAWRGTLIHTALQQWGEQDAFRPDKIVARFEAVFADKNLHPLLTALWMPRFGQAAERFAALTVEARAEGRAPFVVEIKGRHELHGVMLVGRLDRVDKSPDGLVILDYKTGAPPTPKQANSGYRLQLGLIGMMARDGAFPDVSGQPVDFEYWSLARAGDRLHGYKKSALDKKQSAADFMATTDVHFREAVAAWLTGDAPFKAKVQPDYAYQTYDHLMRYDEWAGRDEGL